MSMSSEEIQSKINEIQGEILKAQNEKQNAEEKMSLLEVSLKSIN